MLGNQVAEGIDEADNQLGPVISRRGLGAEEEYPRLHGIVGIVHNAIVKHQDVQGVEQLPLVLMQALGLNIKNEGGVHLNALVLLNKVGQAFLILVLDLGKLFPEGLVIGKGLQIAQRFRIVNPLVTNGLADQVRELGVAAHEPAAMGNAVGNGGEFFGHDLRIVVEGVFLQDLPVKLAYAVHGEGHGHTQVGHMHLVVGDNRHGTNALPLTGEIIPQLRAQAAVQLHQDLIDPGQELLDHVLGPLFQAFRHDGVIGVCYGILYDLSGFIPAQALLIDQQAHQLGNGQARMGVIDMNNHLLRQQAEVRAVHPFEILKDVLQGGTGEEVVLLQAQALALVVVVFGVEYLGNDLGKLLFFTGLHIAPLTKGGQVNMLGAAGGPHAQAIHRSGVIAHNGHIIGNGFHGVIITMDKLLHAVFRYLIHIAVEVYLAGILHHRHFPYVAVIQPVVGKLHLLSVHDFLTEKPVFIADGAAHGRKVQAGQAVQETGGQPAQTAIAQAGFRLLVQYAIQVNAQLLQRLRIHVRGNQVQHVVVQAAAHEKFHGKVIQPLCMAGFALFPCNHPFLHDLVTDGRGNSLVDLLGSGFGNGAAIVPLKLSDDGLLDGLLIERCGWHGSSSLLLCTAHGL